LGRLDRVGRGGEVSRKPDRCLTRGLGVRNAWGSEAGISERSQVPARGADALSERKDKKKKGREKRGVG